MTEPGLRTFNVGWPPNGELMDLDQLTPEDAQTLRYLAAGSQTIVDVGSYFGGSAMVMALEQSRFRDPCVVTVDTFADFPPETKATAHDGRSVEDFAMCYTRARMRRLGPGCTMIVGRSTSVANLMPRGWADLVFIDAAHDYDSVRADMLAWRDVLRPHGIMAGHDFDQMWPEGATPESFIEGAGEAWDRTVHAGVIKAVLKHTKRFATGPEGSSVWWTTVEELTF